MKYCFFCGKLTRSHIYGNYVICHNCYVDMNDEDKQKLDDVIKQDKLEQFSKAAEILMVLGKQKKVVPLSDSIDLELDE